MKTISSLPELLRRRAQEKPEEHFLFYKNEIFNRRDLDLISDGVAWQLKLSHIKQGDRVALLLPNGPEFIAYFFGVLKLGAILVPINTWLKEPEIVYILKNSGASGLVLGPAHHILAENLILQCPDLRFANKIELQSKEHLLFKAKPAQQKEARDFLDSISVAGESPADILYTSGTTGFPKGAVLSHRNWLADMEGLTLAIGMTEKDRMLCFLPLFHVNGQGIGLLSPLVRGASMVLMEKFSPKEFFEHLSQHRCTAFSGVPSIYTVLLSLPEAERYDLSSLRYCICGAAPMPVEVFERFEKKFKAHILEGYGLSEGTCGSSANPPPPGKRKIGSIGIPFPGQQMKIVGEENQELADKEVGEIMVRGDNVMLGYWNNPQATADTLKGGWLHTGDLGYRDKDGYFFIVGRKKEMIIRGGENVYPKEIEEVLYKHPSVQEAAVIGLPDRRYGEELAAFLVLKEGESCSSRDILQFLRDKIADYKIPRRVEFVPSFPKTATGKIQKLKFRQHYVEGAWHQL